MKVKVLNRYKIKSGLSDEDKELMDTIHEQAYQLTVWSRLIPFKEGLDDYLKGYYIALHQLVKTKNALATIAVPNDKKDLYIIELDLLKDGRVFDVYDIVLEEDGVIYADVVELKEMTLEEFEKNDIRKKNMQRMLDTFKH